VIKGLRKFFEGEQHEILENSEKNGIKVKNYKERKKRKKKMFSKGVSSIT